MKAITCLSEEMRMLLTEALISAGESPSDLQEIPSCNTEEMVGFGNSGRGGAKVKRSGPPSKYNQFVSACMKSKNIKGKGQAPVAMKECAAEWQRQKKTR